MSLHGRIDSSMVSLHAEAVFSNPHRGQSSTKDKNSSLKPKRLVISMPFAGQKILPYFCADQRTAKLSVKDLSFLHRLAQEEQESNN